MATPFRFSTSELYRNDQPEGDGEGSFGGVQKSLREDFDIVFQNSLWNMNIYACASKFSGVLGFISFITENSTNLAKSLRYYILIL